MSTTCSTTPSPPTSDHLPDGYPSAPRQRSPSLGFTTPKRNSRCKTAQYFLCLTGHLAERKTVCKSHVAMELTGSWQLCPWNLIGHCGQAYKNLGTPVFSMSSGDGRTSARMGDCPFTDFSLREQTLAQAIKKAPTFAPAEASQPKDELEGMDEDVGNLTLTENLGVTYQSSLSQCLDFFFVVQEGTEASEIRRRMGLAWGEDPLTTLRLVFQLRDVRDGKGEAAAFQECLRWLREKQPKTLLANLEHIPTVGYWKDLLILLVRDVVGDEEYSQLFRGETDTRRRRVKARRNVRVFKSPNTRKQRVSAAYRKDQKAKLAAAELRHGKRQHRIERARERFDRDGFYRELHVTTARLFADALKRDKENLTNGNGVSLVAKWAPTLKEHHDAHTLIASTIAQLLFPQHEFQREGQTYEAYVCMARDRYRKEYIVPLRRAIPVIEGFMAGQDWHLIPYSKVPSVCMKNNKQRFVKHDEHRFEDFRNKVKEGKTTIKASALKPHEIVRDVMRLGDCPPAMAALETAELQWQAYVDKLRESGVLSNSLAICDVSGSMSGTPMEVAIALSLLVSEVTAPPFHGLICTFSSHPELFVVPKKSLRKKVRGVHGMDWGMNTNFLAVFDLILARATKSRVPREGMIKRLFVFSDMEFDSAAGSSYNTHHSMAKTKFNQAGYDLPEIVYWNLRGEMRMSGKTASCPVLKRQKGAALISGFSGQLLKLFMDDGEVEMTPLSVMQSALAKYDYLRVVA